MNTHKIYLLLSSLFVMGVAYAGEALKESICARYPASIVLQVYKVHSVTPLNEQKQLALAEKLWQEEKSLSLVLAQNSGVATTQWFVEWENDYQENLKRNFLESQFVLMQQIKPVSQVLRDSITAEFLKLSKIEIKKTAEQIFGYALSKYSGDHAYFKVLYAGEITDEINRKLAFEMNTYRSRKHSESALLQLETLQRNRFEEFAINVRATQADKVRAKIVSKEIQAKYKEDIDRITIRDKGYPATLGFKLMIQMKDRLNLTPEQLDTIVENTIRLNALMAREQLLDIFGPEQRVMMKIMDESQINTYLTEKNSGRAKKFAIDAWKVIHEKQLQAGLDSVQIVKQISEYQLSLYNIYARYRHDPAMMQVRIDEMAKLRPVALEQLRLAQRKKNTESATDTDPDAAFKGGFVW